MTDRATPETDAEWRRLQSGHLDTIGLASGMCRFAKGLERKRDEAEKQRDRLAEALERLEKTAGLPALQDDPARVQARQALQSITNEEQDHE
jgi:hypothetical protein